MYERETTIAAKIKAVFIVAQSIGGRIIRELSSPLDPYPSGELGLPPPVCRSSRC